jgi:hypothetical protein
MTSNPGVVTPIRPAARPGFPDTNALDDIQALLSSPDHPHAEDAIAEIRQIIGQTGRSLVTPRLLNAETGTESNGLPYAVIDAEGVSIRVAQHPDSGGIHVRISVQDANDEASLAVTVNDEHVFDSRDSHSPASPFVPDGGQHEQS